jgi:DNA-binding protein HU-beta
MNKADLIAALAEGADMTKAQAGTALDVVLTSIKDALAQGDTVAIAGFGSFLVRERAARTGRNPQTGAEVQISASKTPAFKPGKAFKDAL